MRSVIIATIAIGIVSGAGAIECFGGGALTVGQAVPPGGRIPIDQIDHSPWDQLLKKHVNTRGQVDYDSWNKSAADQRQLDAYLNHLASASRSHRASRAAQLAFWINAYNALTVKGILREYPTSSIRNHTAKVFGYNIWHDLKLNVAGKAYSLDEMEHQVLRKMNEPRIHFAIVCASVGCPRLLNSAYTAEKLDEQLTLNARDFFADSTKFRVDAASRTVYVSPILSWFAEDFGENTPAQMKSIAPYVPAAAQATVSSPQARVKYLDYDWGLNDQAQ